MDVLSLMHLPVVVRLTNATVEEHSEECVTEGEILKFFGTSILIMKYHFSNGIDLWKADPVTKYGCVASFGCVISRQKFRLFIRHIKFSSVSERDTDRNTFSRWSFVCGFLESVNKHRER